MWEVHTSPFKEETKGNLDLENKHGTQTAKTHQSFYNIVWNKTLLLSPNFTA
jgi:hypothetical protein